MQKIIRIDDLVIVTLDEGQTYQKSDITDEEFNRIINAECEDDIIEIFCFVPAVIFNVLSFIIIYYMTVKVFSKHKIKN